MRVQFMHQPVGQVGGERGPGVRVERGDDLIRQVGGKDLGRETSGCHGRLVLRFGGIESDDLDDSGERTLAGIRLVIGGHGRRTIACICGATGGFWG